MSRRTRCASGRQPPFSPPTPALAAIVCCVSNLLLRRRFALGPGPRGLPICLRSGASINERKRTQDSHHGTAGGDLSQTPFTTGETACVHDAGPHPSLLSREAPNAGFMSNAAGTKDARANSRQTPPWPDHSRTDDLGSESVPTMRHRRTQRRPGPSPPWMSAGPSYVCGWA